MAGRRACGTPSRQSGRRPPSPVQHKPRSQIHRDRIAARDILAPAWMVIITLVLCRRCLSILGRKRRESSRQTIGRAPDALSVAWDEVNPWQSCQRAGRRIKKIPSR